MNPPSSMQSAPGPGVILDGKSYLYFGGTSYLGLHGHPKIIRSVQTAVQTYGIHPATSRARVGNSPVVRKVEELAAEFFDTPGTFYFVSGYVGCHILVQTAAPEADAVFADESIHFSGREAALLAQKPIHFFKSRDPHSLQSLLKSKLNKKGKALVLTDGINPSVGWIAPIPEYLNVLSKFPGSQLIVDDAHGVAVLGENGRGTLEHLNLWNRHVNGIFLARSEKTRLMLCGTLSKAVGGFGGIIPCSSKFLERLKHRSHYFEASSAPSVADAAASVAGLQQIKSQPELRKQLQQRVAQARDGLRNLGFDIEPSPVPIIGLTLGSESKMKQLSERLQREGIFVPHLKAYPGVGPHGALRIAIFANHTPEMISRLLDSIARNS